MSIIRTVKLVARGFDNLQICHPDSTRPFSCSVQREIINDSDDQYNNLQLPISRPGSGENQAVAIKDLDQSHSRSTVSTWLQNDCLKPLKQTSSVSPRVPDFRRKAMTALNLYDGDEGRCEIEGG